MLRDWLAKRASLMFWLGCGAFADGVALVVAIGLKTGGLLQDSLNFRWNYWVASWHLWEAHPWLGVGWGSFGNSYLKYRFAVQAEEIKDPHNLLIHFLTETGVIGATLLVAWLGRSWYEMTRRWRRALRRSKPAASSPWPPRWPVDFSCCG